MKTYLPYPLLAIGLALMWLLLAGFTPGQFVLAAVVAIGATLALGALGETSPRVRRWRAMPELFAIVLYDIVRSNVAVASILLAGQTRTRNSGFIVVPLRLRHPNALAILSIVLTSTPGTAWIDFSSARGQLLIHVFDLVDEDQWIDLIANRYERLLMEIFE